MKVLVISVCIFLLSGCGEHWKCVDGVLYERITISESSPIWMKCESCKRCINQDPALGVSYPRSDAE